MSSALRWLWSGSLALALALAAVPGRAEEPQSKPAGPSGQQPASAQRPAQQRAPARQANSLASVAAHIKLRGVSDSGGPIVISNSNLSELADRGVVSVGSGVAGAEGDAEPAAGEEPAQAPPFDRAAWEQKVKQQEQKVAALQKAYDGFDEKVREASDPHYGYGAYNLAPGQVSPAAVAKQDLQQKLEEAKKALDALQAEGAKQDVTPSP